MSLDELLGTLCAHHSWRIGCALSPVVLNMRMRRHTSGPAREKVRQPASHCCHTAHIVRPGLDLSYPVHEEAKPTARPSPRRATLCVVDERAKGPKMTAKPKGCANPAAIAHTPSQRMCIACLVYILTSKTTDDRAASDTTRRRRKKARGPRGRKFWPRAISSGLPLSETNEMVQRTFLLLGFWWSLFSNASPSAYFVSATRSLGLKAAILAAAAFLSSSSMRSMPTRSASKASSTVSAKTSWSASAWEIMP